MVNVGEIHTAHGVEVDQAGEIEVHGVFVGDTGEGGANTAQGCGDVRTGDRILT